MHGMHAITDMHRIATIEAQSARPNSPQRPDKGPRRSLLNGLRMTMTVALRRIADALEPKHLPCAATAPVHTAGGN